jgi:hypothetical protein
MLFGNKEMDNIKIVGLTNYILLKQKGRYSYILQNKR